MTLTIRPFSKTTLTIKTFSITKIRITTLTIVTFSLSTLSIKTLTIVTFNITTLSITTLNGNASIFYAKYRNKRNMPSVVRVIVEAAHL